MPGGSGLPQQDESAALDLKIQRRFILVATDEDTETGFSGQLTQELAVCGIEKEAVMQLCPVAGNGASGPWSQLLQAVEGLDGSKVDIVHLIGAFEDATAPMTTLYERVKNLSSLLQALGARKARLWIVAPGGARAVTGAGRPSPVQSGIWAYARTAGNEYGDLDIRLIDFARDLDWAGCARRLAALLLDPGAETELVLTSGAIQTLRVKRGLPDFPLGVSGQKKTEAVVLTQPTSSSLDQIRWMPARLRAPKPGEVQIEVAATGLNFRDVMWAQGLLPEEALEDGFAGPTLGFECSGRICAIGEGVEGFAIGDPVMALAPSCFASHVSVSDIAVSKLPGTIDLVAAAALPVA